MDEDVYVAEGHRWTRKELQHFFTTRDCRPHSARLVAFGLAMLLRDKGWDKASALDGILNWADPPVPQSFITSATNAVNKVFDDPEKHQFHVSL